MTFIKWKKLLIFLGLITTLGANLYSADFTKEQLDELRQTNAISQEDYELLLSELGEGSYLQKGLYTLEINGTKTSEQFEILKVGGKEYFPLFSFFEQISLTNYTDEKGVLVVQFGEDLRELIVDRGKKYISYQKEREKGSFGDLVVEKDGEIYLEREVFSKYFIEKITKNDNLQSITMKLNFNPPSIVKLLVDKAQRELNTEKNKKELIYRNERKLFELGNVGIDIKQIYTRGFEDKKSDWDWEGNVEYKGSLLYGDIYTGYDLKENRVGNTYLIYDDVLVKKHKLELGSYITNSDAREWGVSFKKDLGYYEEGKNFIIEADVPVGSRVELLYYGVPIEIQNSEDGRVRFENPAIKRDNTYFLKIYSPDGRIELREIYTAEVYNQQKKDEVEYDINLREDNDSGKVRGTAKAYYGFTDNFTLGLGVERVLEEVKKETSIVEMGSLELLYSNFLLDKYGYRVEYERNQAINLFENVDNEATDDRYIDRGLFEIDINKVRFTLENNSFGKYYEEENSFRFHTEYRPIDSLRLDYEYKNTKYRAKENESLSTVGASYTHKLGKNLLISPEIEISNEEENNSYSLDIYYTGFGNNTVTFENTWSGKNEEYEAELKIYNSDIFGMLDYDFGVSYSEDEKEKFTFEFTLRYNTFFEMTSRIGDMGTREFTAGVDAVFDLRNVKRFKPMESIDVMNAKVVAFVDGNNNNIYDAGEEKLKNVEIELGGQTAITDRDGVAYFSGISNGVAMELKPTIRQPNYTLGDTTVKVEGRGTSTVQAYLPVKPMITLSGMVDIDKKLKLSESETQDLYENLIVTVKDKNSEVIEITTPDEVGVFAVSGLFTDEYEIEVEYIGTRLNIPKLVEKIQVAYNNSPKTEVLLAVSDKKMELNKES